jgi:hypothetical protein
VTQYREYKTEEHEAVDYVKDLLMMEYEGHLEDSPET